MKYLSKNRYWSLNEDYDIDKILYLLIDRPNIINFNNDYVWKNKKGQYHREYDLPAVFENNNISIEWWKNNNYHRESNKVAIIWSSGKK